MTAEVVIMNKESVAMAADSAVSIQGGKVFYSANKLYMLAPGHAVGVLIFNNANFMNVPWEIIIKTYRDELLSSNTRYGTLSDYANDFLRFLRANDGKIITQEQQDMHFLHLLEGVIRNDIRAAVELESAKHMMTTGKAVDDETFVGLVNGIIETIFDMWDADKDLIEDEAEKDKVIENLTQQYRPIFEQIYAARLGNLPISDENKERFWRTCIYWYLKDRWFDYFYSGLVFAGYGDDELFPVCEAYQLESMFRGYMKLKQTSRIQMSWEPGGASINPYAQNDIMINLLSGAHPEYERILRQQFAEALAQDFTSEDVLNQKINEIIAYTKEAARINLTNPIMTIVSALPKDELATMAESLVNVTSFMRRVSHTQMATQETVGGPVDVAVISKKDGFIWIKRKHYFKPELNYHFFAKYNNGADYGAQKPEE
jgi:hypothetical protein